MHQCQSRNGQTNRRPTFSEDWHKNVEFYLVLYLCYYQVLFLWLTRYEFIHELTSWSCVLLSRLISRSLIHELMCNLTSEDRKMDVEVQYRCYQCPCGVFSVLKCEHEHTHTVGGEKRDVKGFYAHLPIVSTAICCGCSLASPAITTICSGGVSAQSQKSDTMLRTMLTLLVSHTIVCQERGPSGVQCLCRDTGSKQVP